MHIKLDPNVRPVHAQVHWVPVAKLDGVNEELQRLCNEGIIKPVTGSQTPWKRRQTGNFDYALIRARPSIGPSEDPSTQYPAIEEKLPLLTNANVFTIYCWLLRGLSYHRVRWRIILSYHVSGAKRLLLLHQDVVWSFRDKISVYDGMVYRSHQVIVPSSLWQEMLQKIHKAYQVANSSIRQACKSLFWPGMQAAIKESAFHVDFMPNTLASDLKKRWNLIQYQPDCGQK